MVAVANTEYGERPIAFVRMVTGHKLNGNKIAVHLRKQLAGYKVPDVFLEWPTDIESSGIKPPRVALAERAAQLTKYQKALI